jgi:hypothetical protein
MQQVPCLSTLPQFLPQAEAASQQHVLEELIDHLAKAVHLIFGR